MKKKRDTALIISVIALILAVIAIVNSFSSGAITGYSVDRDDIVYNDGYVGIGVLHPDQKFHVGDGDALFEDDVVIEDNLEVQDDADLGALIVQGDSILNNVNATGLYVNGSVVVDGDVTADNIGEIEVEMVLDVLDSAPTCGSSNEGYMYVDNSTTPVKLKVCVDGGFVEIELASSA